MKALTLSGYLDQVIRQLAIADSSSLQVLAFEAEKKSPRLRAPLAIKAILKHQTGRLGILWMGTRSAELYGDFLSSYDEQHLLSSMESSDPSLPVEVMKIWTSYVSERDRFVREAEVKTMLHPHVVAARENSPVSVYRACLDLGLNQSNVYTWLRTGNPKYITLDGARSLVQYFLSHSPNNRATLR